MNLDEHLDKLHAALRDGDGDAAREHIAVIDDAVTATRAFVPVGVLQEALAVAQRFGPGFALRTGNVLAQGEPGAFITPGQPYLLVACDAVLRSDASTYVTRLWRNLVVNDPPSVPAIAETEFVVDLPELSLLLTNCLRDMAKAEPRLAFDVSTSLATMRQLRKDAEDEVTQAIEDALLEVSEQYRLQTVATEIGRATFIREPAPILDSDEALGSPDPRVDDLLGRAAARDEWLAPQAIDELTEMAQKPSWALTTGLCEAIGDLWKRPRDEDLAWKLSYLLFLAASNNSKRIPAKAVMRLLELPDITTRIAICLLAALVRAEPELVIDEYAERALHWTVAEPSLAARCDVWTLAAVVRPDPVITFTTEWWAREGWASRLGRLLSSSLVGLVKAIPDYRDRIVRLLEQQVVAKPTPKPGMIALSVDPTPEDDLRRIKATH